MKQDGIGRETNHKRLLISQNKQGCWGEGGQERRAGLWILGKVCPIVSAVKCKPGDSQTCTPGDKNICL